MTEFVFMSLEYLSKLAKKPDFGHQLPKIQNMLV